MSRLNRVQVFLLYNLSKHSHTNTIIIVDDSFQTPVPSIQSRLVYYNIFLSTFLLFGKLFQTTHTEIYCVLRNNLMITTQTIAKQAVSDGYMWQRHNWQVYLDVSAFFYLELRKEMLLKYYETQSHTSILFHDCSSSSSSFQDGFQYLL